MPNKKFNIELLKYYIQRDNAILIGNYNTLHRISYINFICSCNINTTKTFRMIVEGHGAFCKKCDKQYSINNAKNNILNKDSYNNENRIKYTKDTLDSLAKTNNAIILKYPDNINSKSLINFQCYCNSEYNKIFRQAYTKSGLYCDKCTLINQQHKTNRKIYDISLLNNICDMNSISIISYNKLSKNSIINFKCKCNNESSKKFYNLYNFPYCNICTEKLKLTNMQNTCLIKYGVINPTQNADILYKSDKHSKRFKNYTLPSGNIIKIQGYEHLALNELVQIYSEDDINTGKNAPRVKYIKNNSEHYYFPDIYIKSINKIIEVKSSWTYNKDIETNQLKGNACKNKGYSFEFWIYNSKLHKEIKTI